MWLWSVWNNIFSVIDDVIVFSSCYNCIQCNYHCHYYNVLLSRRHPWYSISISLQNHKMWSIMIHMSMKKEVFMILTYIIFTKWQNFARSWWRLIRFTKILFCYKKAHTWKHTLHPKSNNNKIKYTYYNFLEWRHQCLSFYSINLISSNIV